jgi:hypothetical protein
MNQEKKLNITPAVMVALAAGDVHNAMAAAVPGGIEAQEAAGQAMLVASQQLPNPGRDRPLFEKLGFVFGDPVDELFVTAQLPPGWTKKASEHAMNSYVLDEKGRMRVNVFYKAAFYDRRADMSLIPRYRLRSYQDVEGQPGVEAVRLIDNDGSAIREFGTYKNRDYDALDKIEMEAMEWMAKELPDWNNPLAYWELTP